MITPLKPTPQVFLGAGEDDFVGPPAPEGSGIDTNAILNAVVKAAPGLSSGDQAAIVSGAVAIGGAIGTFGFPIVGTALGMAIGAAIGSISHFIRTATQKYDWNVANDKAQAYAVSVATALQSGMTSDQFSYLSKIFPPMVKSFVASSNWWDATTRATLLQDYDSNVAKQITDYDRVRQAMWEASIWIYGNIDIARPETFLCDFMNPFLKATLVPAMQQTGTKFKINVDVPGGPILPPPPANKPNTSSMNPLLIGGLAAAALVMVSGNHGR